MPESWKKKLLLGVIENTLTDKFRYDANRLTLTKVLPVNKIEAAKSSACRFLYCLTYFSLR